MNNNYQPADALTKLSSAGARLDLLISIMTLGRYRITFCDRSGRREISELGVKHSVECFFIGT